MARLYMQIPWPQMQFREQSVNKGFGEELRFIQLQKYYTHREILFWEANIIDTAIWALKTVWWSLQWPRQETSQLNSYNVVMTFAVAILFGETESAHCVLLGPGPCSFLIALPLVLVHVGDLRDKGVVRVGVSEERADGEEDLWYGQCRAPLLLEDIKANAPIRVDVWVINLVCFQWNNQLN